MNYKKWLLIFFAVILLAISQQRDFIYQWFSLFDLSKPPIVVAIILQILNGILVILNRLFTFLTSWEGVLLIGFILLYLSIKKEN